MTILEAYSKSNSHKIDIDNIEDELPYIENYKIIETHLYDPEVLTPPIDSKFAKLLVSILEDVNNIPGLSTNKMKYY